MSAIASPVVSLPDESLATPPRYSGIPQPLDLPFALKPVSSADTGVETLPDGRMRFWSRHNVVRRYNRYRFWHPQDHVHASYARRLPDGSIGPGAEIRLIEVLGGNEKFVVDTVTHIERLDEGGYIHNPEVFGRTGLARMEYTFEPVSGGTLYENCLIIGTSRPVLRLANPLRVRLAFDEAHGRAWLRHNIEEVGMFENFLPALYRQETGRSC